MNEFGITWVLVEGLNDPFYMSDTPVTFDQYDAFCQATGHAKPKDSNGRGKHPVVNVNIADANAFCEWLNKLTNTTIRLPEEDEWEFAARGGNKSKGFKFSGSDTLDDVAWYFDNSDDTIHEVSTKLPNELGLYDMLGNVWEWCGTDGRGRGGAYDDQCSIKYSCADDPSVRYGALGFRIIKIR
jgi:formylglycine-generating enzyme required for sulfatase activity